MIENRVVEPSRSRRKPIFFRTKTMIFSIILLILYLLPCCLTLSNTEVEDFMFEDECLTPGVLNPSSVACKSRRNIGGITPYYRMDNGLFMAKHSFARERLDGSGAMISTFDFRQTDGSVPNTPGGVPGHFGIGAHEKNYAFGNVDKVRDGGDFLE
jgi:hypothetical protein